MGLDQQRPCGSETLHVLPRKHALDQTRTDFNQADKSTGHHVTDAYWHVHSRYSWRQTPAGIRLVNIERRPDDATPVRVHGDVDI